jgi:hypothetical protein
MVPGGPPNRERFLAAIAERVAPARVQVLYLFAPMRQGAIESGVAVIAVDPISADQQQLTGTDRADVADQADSATDNVSNLSPRPVVLTARYKHTLRGADRGKWELEIFEEADAPLVTVERVVQGVQRRLDDAVEPECLGADALRAAMAEGVWTPPPR